ncbi:MAG TPA: response regulator transcription factor [Candidatus Obscuribacterales bacterium]
MAKILVVEDDPSVSGTINDWLTSQLHVVEIAATGNEAVELLEAYPYDLIVLDLHLPDIDGLEILKKYRNGGGTAPVLILTGRQSVSDRERGLDAGADDYLCKPFHVRELSARLRALMRRAPTPASPKLTVGNLTLDPDNCAAVRDGKSIKLQPKEFALLELFMRNPGRIFSSEALLDRVWQSDSETSPDTIRVHITKLRSKIDLEGKASVISTIKGVGYKLDAEACV